MSEQEPVPTELWTPPETLPVNVGKMAWALFLERWKTGQGVLSWREIYLQCIQVARELEDINQDPPKRESKKEA